MRRRAGCYGAKSATLLVAGVTSTRGGVVFTGDLDGNLLAFDDREGRLLWKDDTRLPIGGGIVTYAVIQAAIPPRKRLPAYPGVALIGRTSV
jgi:outer membrane protein assembly factor BamB